MWIYLASRYGRRLELQDYAGQLVAKGHNITSRWLMEEHELHSATPEQRVQFAQEDARDLIQAQCVISFTEDTSSVYARGGRHVEFGMAVAWEKRLIVVGYRENVFHYLPRVEFCATWDDVLELL